MTDAIAELDRQMAFAPDIPSPLLDAIMDVRNELSRRIKVADPQSLAFEDYESWCDRIGVAARVDYAVIPHCTLAAWYTRGLSVEETIPLVLDYLGSPEEPA